MNTASQKNESPEATTPGSQDTTEKSTQESFSQSQAHVNGHDENPVLRQAQEALAAGISVLPVTADGKKNPGYRNVAMTWKEYQSRLPTNQELGRWFTPRQEGVGIITGAVSGGLEALDFDRYDRFQEFCEILKGIGHGALLDRLCAGYLDRSPNGAHLLYRCETIEGNQKLAEAYDCDQRGEIRRTPTGKPLRKSLIETRGTGGFLVIPPSHGRTHPSGKPYIQISGGLSTIATISPEERATVFDVARSLNEVREETTREEHSQNGQAKHRDTRPGDIYNREVTWGQVLEPHGWTKVYERNGATYWRRPGKDQDVSATTNYAGSDLLYVFSTSTDFESERGYSKFSAYALLNHTSDFVKAAEALMRQGYYQKGEEPHSQRREHEEPKRDNAPSGGDTEPAWPEMEEEALPRIIISNEHLRDGVDNSLDALKQRNSPPSLFVRAGQIARVQFDERQHPMIVSMKEPALRERLSRDADFYRLTKKKEEWIETKVSPPKDIVESILALPEWPFPALYGVVECPILRPDGTILDTPGYDPVTHLYHAPAPGLIVPKVPEHPTEEDIKKSLNDISELFCDFKFVNTADQANAWGSLLTPIARPAILGNVPLALFDKPTPGTGATYLADNIATMATGFEAPKQMIPEGRGSEEEWKKKILSILLRDPPVVVFDNVSELASDTLSSLLTTQWWQDRLLGSNTQVRLPVRVTWIATANNIALRGDLPRRCYRVRLDARMERPSQRDDFKHPNLLDWTLKNRGVLLAAILTLSRAWFSAGEPKAKVPQLVGYGEWSRVIGGILAHVGVTGFLENLHELYELVDDEGTQWAAFLKVWFDEFGCTPKLISDFCGVLIANPALIETIPETITFDVEKLDVFKKRLGKALKKRIDRIYGDYRLERLKKDSHAKTALWRVVEVRGFAGFGATPGQDEKKSEEKKNGTEGDSKQTRETRETPHPGACAEESAFRADSREADEGEL